MNRFEGVLGGVKTLELRDPPRDLGGEGDPQKKIILFINAENNHCKGPQSIEGWQQKLLADFFGEDYKFLILNGVSHIQGIS